jgi:photosystem II stability/assembly factor-like uncharacterized protein
MAICLSHGGTTIYSSQKPSTDLLVGTVDGVVFLKREGRGDRWQVVKRTLRDHHVISLLIEPTTETVFATMHNGGVAASNDFGETWEFRNDGLASDNVYCIASSEDRGKVTLYVGTEPAHLYESDDMGSSWKELAGLLSVPSVPKWTFPAPPHNAHVKNINVDPRDPSTVYACVEQGGLFKSVDRGTSWRELEGFNDDCHRLLIMPSDSNKIYMPTGYGFYRSNNGGDTWENISSRVSRIGYPDPMVFHPSNEKLMFVAGGEADPYHWMQTKSANPRIARTRDGGDNWDILGEGMPEHMDSSFEAMILETSGDSCEIYAGNTDGEIYYSDDEGETWSKTVGGIPPVSKTIHYTILQSGLSFDKHNRALPA